MARSSEAQQRRDDEALDWAVDHLFRDPVFLRLAADYLRREAEQRETMNLVAHKERRAAGAFDREAGRREISLAPRP